LNPTLMLFRNRKHAGELLALKLASYKNDPHAVVVALPRGGVVVGREIARALNLPLEITVPRKITLPSHPEFAIGAITESGEGFFNEKLIHSYDLPQNQIEAQVEKEKAEAKRRLDQYRGKKIPLSFKNKKIILVDD